MSGVGPRTANTYKVGAPSNYVAGVGRGAMGFTTRSDIGPARAAGAVPGTGPPVADAQFGVAPAGYVAGRGRGMGDLARNQSEMNVTQLQQEADRGDYSESNYDEFSGYGEKLFTLGSYEEDDIEADQIYDAVDGMMDGRRKRSREQQLLLEKKRAKNERPRIADQFADLKRELTTVSAEQWDAIPDVGDHSLKLKQSRKKESFAPVPDYLIESAQRATTAGSSATMLQTVDPNASSELPKSSPFDSLGVGTGTGTGAMGGGGGGAGATGLVAAESRGNELSSKLDKMSDSVTGQTVVDPRGYLTGLNSLKVTSEAEVGDIKKARILLQSVITTNPKHGPGWIAAARVEEFAGKMAAARKVIIQGCEQCPESEDVWLEAARLHPTDMAKTLLANAVLQLPTSVKIWLRATDLESLESRKKAVLRRSLEFVPNSVKLWKSAIELENVTDARIMLARAVECVPHSVEMWLALAKLESHENARRVLNQAREANPTERATWITAAKLEEAHGNTHLVGRIIEKMMQSLTQYQVTLDRESWIKEAQDCEHAGALATCEAIVRHTIHLGVEAEDLRTTWMDDAETVLQRQQPPQPQQQQSSDAPTPAPRPPSVATARAILSVALEKFPTKKLLWQQAAMLEKEYGDAGSLEAKLQEGVKHCPQAEVLWLMAAKEKWLGGDVPGARSVLVQAFNENPQSQQIWLAAIKLEWENEEFVRARLLLTKARERASSERVWLKAALLEREVGDSKQALQLLEQAIAKYPGFVKYYLMAGQICDEDTKEPVRARNAFLQGLKVAPDCVPLWRHLIRLEEKVKGVIKARPTGETARMKLPRNDLVWLECIRLERRAGNEKLAQSLMARALQECPKSGALWAEELLTCAKPLQKSRCIDALKRCIDDPLVLVAVGRLFERGGRVQKARRRFERALALMPKLGDGWIHYYAMEYVQCYKSELSKGSSAAMATSSTTSSSSNSSSDMTGEAAAHTGASVTTKEVGSRTRRNVEEDDGIDSVDEDEEEEEEEEEEELLRGKAGTGHLEKDGDTEVEKGGGGGGGTVAQLETPSMSGTNGTSSNHTSNGANSYQRQLQQQRELALESLASRCQAAQPNRGELWCAGAKETKLRRLEAGKLLLVLVERLLGAPLEKNRSQAGR